MHVQTTHSQQPQFNKSVTYSITANNIIERNSEYILYRFPYSKHTFWTNFRLARFGQNGMQQKTPPVEILLITADGTECVVQSYCDTVPKTNTISNPIPSMKYNDTDGQRMGVYFRVYLSEHDTIAAMPFHLIGYIHLFPSAPYYQYTYNHMIQYVFLRSTDEDDREEENGIILTVLLDYPSDSYAYDRKISAEYSDVHPLSV
jgi:hypothetical protein